MPEERRCAELPPRGQERPVLSDGARTLAATLVDGEGTLATLASEAAGALSAANGSSPAEACDAPVAFQCSLWAAGSDRYG